MKHFYELQRVRPPPVMVRVRKPPESAPTEPSENHRRKEL